MFGLRLFSPLHGLMRYPQLLLNESKDFNITACIVRIHNGDVHIMSNLIFDNFAEDIDVCLDLYVFHSFMGQCL